MEQVRRASDGELCGFVAPRDDRWAARGYSSMPCVPTLSIATEQLAAGEWELRRDS